MAMTMLWSSMVVISILCGLYTGQAEAVAQGAVTGATDAFALCLSIGGMVCLWSGVMEVMRQSGLAQGLSRLLRPILRPLYPKASGGAMDSIAANVSANLLGLGSAATPLGLDAARRLDEGHGRATDALCMLVVCNTASIQLIPTTVAALRATAGSGSPMDILPAVWLASACSVAVGISACGLFSRLWRD